MIFRKRFWKVIKQQRQFYHLDFSISNVCKFCANLSLRQRRIKKAIISGILFANNSTPKARYWWELNKSREILTDIEKEKLMSPSTSVIFDCPSFASFVFSLCFEGGRWKFRSRGVVSWWRNDTSSCPRGNLSTPLLYCSVQSMHCYSIQSMQYYAMQAMHCYAIALCIA